MRSLWSCGRRKKALPGTLRFMSSELARKAVPARRRFARRNTMAFPRELRAAIPDPHAGRVLELDSINGRSTNTPFGTLVDLAAYAALLDLTTETFTR